MWIKNYIDTVTSQNAATLLTATAQSGFKNNDTYQQLLNLLQVNINLFASIGRLFPVPQALAASLGMSPIPTGFITAPPFNLLPPASGGVFIVPKAWAALYAQDVTSSIIYGTLVLQA
jgi:hypothetical protein